MANKLVLLALIFTAVVGMASAEDEGGDHVIGSVSGGSAEDAAPVGGPVPDGVFPNLTPAPAPGNGAAALQVTTVSVAVAVAGVVGSFFF